MSTGTLWIAVKGYAGAGKDALAAHLVHQHGYLQTAFADPMRGIATAVDAVVGTTGDPDRVVRFTDAFAFTGPTTPEAAAWQEAAADFVDRFKVAIDALGLPPGPFGTRRRAAWAMARIIDPIIGHRDPDAALIGYREALTDHGYTEAKRRFPELRRFLQRLGTEAGRDLLGADLWVDRTIEVVRSTKRVVISDLRFANEAAAVRRAGGAIVEVVRPGVGPANDHVSEHGDFPVDLIVLNDGTLDDLADVTVEIALWLALGRPRNWFQQDPCRVLDVR